MKACKFAHELAEAADILAGVGSDEPAVVTRGGRDGDELPVKTVKVRRDKTESFIILETMVNTPTNDAYLAACRALHWRTAQLKANGIEPVRLPKDASYYPPEDFDWTKLGKPGQSRPGRI